MKIKKLLAAIAAAITATAFLCGCSVISFDSSEIMRPPKATGDKAQIQEIIEQKAGASYTLKYPQNGKYKSAITQIDVDADGESESVAFFKTNGEDQPIHILIIDETDGKWQAIGDFENDGTEVDRLDFADLNGDGKSEIIVGWNVLTGGPNKLCAYFIKDEKVSQAVCDDVYKDFVIGSFSKDEKTKEIMLFSLFASEESASAKLVTCKDKENPVFVVSSTVGMNNETVSYENIVSGKISNDQNGVVVDGLSQSGDYSTQVIYYNKNISSLVNSFYTGTEDGALKTLRKEKIFSSDIDNDEIIEVPVSVKMEKELNEKEENVANQICWSQYIIESNSYLANQTVVINSKYGYSMMIPDKWLSKVTARVDDGNATLTFYRWISNKNSSKKGDVLLTVKVFDADDWMNSDKKDKFVLADKNSRYAYTYTIPDNNDPLILSDSEVKGMFVINSEQ